MKKKFLPLLAIIIITTTTLLPLGIPKAEAVSYYPTYTCYNRDIAGSCLIYQTSNPHHLRKAKAVTQRSTWNNRYAHSQYHNFRYEEDDDDNDYIDDDDDYFKYHNNDKWPTNRSLGADWRNYYDEDDDTIRAYRYQKGNDYSKYDHKKSTYFEYEFTRTYCTGSDCRLNNR